MDYIQAVAIWIAMTYIREYGVPVGANISQPEEVLVPFRFPSVKPELTEEAKPPVAIPTSSSKAMPVGV